MLKLYIHISGAKEYRELQKNMPHNCVDNVIVVLMRNADNGSESKKEHFRV